MNYINGKAASIFRYLLNTGEFPRMELDSSAREADIAESEAGQGSRFWIQLKGANL